MATVDTQSKLLDHAEQLFARRGFSDVSLREIIAEAGVNLAAVHYHFGSREALIHEVLARRIDPMNAERLDLLERAEQRAGKKPPTIKSLLEALIAPPLRLCRDARRGGDLFMLLIGRAMSDPNDRIQEILLDQFKELAARFLPAFQKALPRLPAEDLFWRLHFTIGGMIHSMTHSHHLRTLSHGACDIHDTEQVIQRLVTFAEAGLRARTS